MFSIKIQLLLLTFANALTNIIYWFKEIMLGLPGLSTRL